MPILRPQSRKIKLGAMNKPEKPLPPPRIPLDRKKISDFVMELFEDDLHAKRVLSLADATLGTLAAGALGIHAIGRGLAASCGLISKHAVKQVDRLVGNAAIDIMELARVWVPYVLAERKQVHINLDWTDFDADDQTTLVLSVQTSHGRTTPLLWKTWRKSNLKDHRNDYEDELLLRLREVVPQDVRVTIVADRGFADTKLYEFLTKLNFDYAIRFRSAIHVTSEQGVTRKAIEWIGNDGKQRVLRRARVTAKEVPVATVLCVRDAAMKDAWCIASSDPEIAGASLKAMYGKRFSIEEMFRDQKDIRYGMGLGWRKVGDPGRRDRLLLIAALAQTLLTVLGAAGEALGMDRMLKTNTSKTRTLSLFRQGLQWYELLPNMPEKRLKPLMAKFDELVQQHEIMRSLLGVI